MVKRRQKKRTHVAGPSPAESKIPQSMVLRIGGANVGISLSQLVQDVRTIMEPHTAVKLRERKANKLKDYLVMAGPLGVSHLLLFSKTQSNETSLRIAHAPHGPTIHFRVLSYSLCKDIRRVQRHPLIPNVELQTPPLLVLNGFAPPADAETATDKAHLRLLTSMFQNMFPVITASGQAIKKIKRVMLVNLNQETNEVEIRHYLISTKTLIRRKPVPKFRIKKEEETEKSIFHDEDDEDDEDDRDIRDEDDVLESEDQMDEDEDEDEEEDDDDDDETDEQDKDKFLPYGSSNSKAKLHKLLASKKRLSKNLPKLGKKKDIADYILKEEDGELSGVTSESEAEDDDMLDDSFIQDTKPRAQSTGKKAVKLIELGPRLKLKLIKIQNGLCEGDVLYHAFETKNGKTKRLKKSKQTKRTKRTKS
ncbi:Brix domain-containing protein [Lipomyces japonicus]|uniref:Brix domain-containing protein n=1 Tax=Lipomyces japonicus TaxID=56871 RepID=UPI0034CD3A91